MNRRGALPSAGRVSREVLDATLERNASKTRVFCVRAGSRVRGRVSRAVRACGSAHLARRARVIFLCARARIVSRRQSVQNGSSWLIFVLLEIVTDVMRV